LEASTAYRPIFERKPLMRLNWPRDLFYTCNEGYAEPELIDLTGPARFLIWGPLLHLPKGNWIVKIEFEVSENLSGTEVEADIHDGQRFLIVTKTALPREGKFSFELPFRVEDPQLPIQVRISLLKGAIEGKFGLRSMSLRREEPSIANQVSTSSSTIIMRSADLNSQPRPS
jgi:hypothetical protein